jgi:carbonic anhydrase/acetyltransferase-like protein (isoleucine patch superfamily)
MSAVSKHSAAPFSTKLSMIDDESKHRAKLPMYDLEPKIEHAWVAPNATVVGETRIRRWASVWHNAVIRGDINRVDLHHFASIGAGTVISTAASLPTGMSARCYIGRNVQVGAGCSLYSCHIDDDSVIGDKCVILEGARIEKSAEIAPNSVVPPGRLIPTGQLWGGNPCVFIKDLNMGERWSNYSKSYSHSALGDIHKNEFTMWNSSYLHREASMEDAIPDE